MKDDDQEFVEPKEMLKRLFEDNKELTERMLAAHIICKKYNDVATSSTFETYIDETERSAWFLFQTHNNK